MVDMRLGSLDGYIVGRVPATAEDLPGPAPTNAGVQDKLALGGIQMNTATKQNNGRGEDGS